MTKKTTAEGLGQRLEALEEEVTKGRLAQQSLHLSQRFLEIANGHSKVRLLLKALIAEIQKCSGCEAVGIRILDDEGNIPYQGHTGFSESFYMSENSLSINSHQCMCINVIKGDADPSLPFYTKAGSFFMNGTTRFLTTVSEEDKGKTRNVCNEVGYESVALIPIYNVDRIFGLIHLADPRENMVPLDMVTVLENSAKQLGTAIRRVSTEEVRQKSEKNLSKAQEIARLGSWEWNVSTNAMLWSDEMYRIYGIDPGVKPSFDCVRERIHPDDIGNFDKAVSDTLQGRTLGPLEFRVVAGDYISYLQSRSEITYDESGKPEYMLGTLQDITANKRSEHLILMANKRLQYLLRSTAVVVYTMKASGDYQLTFISNNIANIVGYGPQDFLRKSSFWIDQIHPEDMQHVLLNLPALKTNDSFTHEYRFRRQDGTYIWLRDQMRLIRDKDDNPLEIVGYRIDISRQKGLEQEMLEARRQADRSNRAKSAFLANVSHEIRTPISAILGMTHMMLDSHLDSDTSCNLERIRMMTDSLLSIIDDILDFSKIEAGKLVLAPQDIDLHTVLHTCMDTSDLQARNKGLGMEIIINPAVPKYVRADSGRLRQVLNNLLSNAVKFTEGGQIRVQVTRMGDSDHPIKLHIEVSDSGIGISDENLSMLFQSFSQIDTSYSKEHGGIGLGLAISKELVQIMGGSLGVRSTLGVGSTFYFAIPVLEAEEESLAGKDEPSEQIPGHLPPLNILVAEDEPLHQQYLLHLLQKEGHSVVAVSDGSQVIEALKTKPFNLVIMDVAMPGMDGFEATRRIRSASSEAFDAEIPIIALSAYATSRDRDHIMTAGMGHYLTKPVDRHDLLLTIATAMAQEHEHLGHGKNGSDTFCKKGYVEELKHFLAEYQEDGDWLKGFLNRFVEETPSRMNMLEQALVDNQSRLAADSAHRIISVLGAICVSSTAQCARDLERAALNNEMENAKSRFKILQHEMHCITEYVNGVLNVSDHRDKEAPISS